MIKRNPYMAALLSLGAPGLGHIYSGKVKKGLVLFTAGFIHLPFFYLFWVNGKSPGNLYIWVIASLIVCLLVVIYAVVDSFILAKKVKVLMTSGILNKWYIYCLFIFACFSITFLSEPYFRNNLFQAFHMSASSMKPTLQRNEYLMVNKVIYKRSVPQRGDLVVFLYPKNRNILYIKRLVGLPGDQIEIKDSKVILNKKILGYESIDNSRPESEKGNLFQEIIENKRYTIMITDAHKNLKNFKQIIVPEGQGFVLGDNRSNSYDSRLFGFVPMADIVGKAEFIYFSTDFWDRFGKIE